MENRCIFRKYTAMLALAVSAMVFLPEALFAKGAVVGYVYGLNDVSDVQLDKLTHIMVSDLYMDANGNVFPNPELTRANPNWVSEWLDDLVERAHAKGVNVSIVIANGKDEFTGTEYYNFASATTNVSPTFKRKNLVDKIAKFVTDNQLDGASIDWEYPGLDKYGEPLPDPQHQINEWNQCITLLTELKTKLGACKRVSIALNGDHPVNYPNLSIPENIWAKVDAIHLMTYDIPYNPHSDVTKSIATINAWGALQNTDLGRKKEKLFMGCAFYGKDNQGNKVPYYDNTNPFNPGDTPGNNGSAADRKSVV